MMRTTACTVSVLAVAAIALTACSGSGGGGGGDSASALHGADLVAAAKKEGGLTFYTTYTNDEAAALGRAFGRSYPGVRVTVLQGSVDKLTARIGTEQKAHKYNADVFQGDASYAVQLVRSGALTKYEAPDRPATTGLDLPTGYRNVDAVLTTVVAYNPTAVAQAKLPVPTAFADLAAPAWKGKFGVDDTGVNWYESLVNSMGHAKAQALITSLGRNSPRLQESHTLALTQVQAGEPAATAAAYGYKAAAQAKKTPHSMAFANTNPLPSAPDLVALAAHAPHLQAARLFVNWLESKTGQQALVDISGRISLRKDVASDPAAWDPARWKPAWSTPSASAGKFNAYAAELRAAYGAQ